MNKKIFKEELMINVGRFNMELKEKQMEQLYEYMMILLEWNKKINITRIEEPKEIILKHFVDSLIVSKYINKEDKIIDIGTGGGFPGVPLKILMPETKITLLDSLNKRILFLDEVVKKIKLENIETVHSRAEDAAHNPKYREQYDVAVSRAVASLNVLIEYSIPFVKVKGKSIAMKGTNVEEEMKMANETLQKLNSRIENVDEYFLTNNDFKRNNIVIRKNGRTEDKYPRKPGIIKNTAI